MFQSLNRRAALCAGVSIVVFSGLAPSAQAGEYAAIARISAPPPTAGKSALTPAARRKTAHKKDAKADKRVAHVPAGQLQLVVSIDRQRVTLFADGHPVSGAPVSTGTKGHPTPMGVFTVIQKDRHHISNLYNASMPYMQRITWSGSAIHQGPLPGYPASHGCIRTTNDFASYLWKATRLGVRVIVTKPDVVPVAIQHARLFGPKPKVAAAPAAVPLVRTAEAANIPGTVMQDGSPEPVKAPAAANAEAAPAPATTETTSTVPPLRPAVAAAPAAPEAPKIAAARRADERWTVTESAAGYKDRERMRSPVSVFVSRKTSKLYVRQGMEPVFDMPVTIQDPKKPIGTHIYTALGTGDDGASMRWNVITIPSGYPRSAAAAKHGKGKRSAKHEKPVHHEPLPPASNASTALDRLELPAEAVERITAMMMPGSSLVVSDNGISDETGQYTDFIILTR